MTRQQLAPRLATLAVMAVLGSAGTASADDQPTQRVWLAANADHSTAGSAWGRLVIKDGMLAFHGSLADWTTPLSEIRRVSRVKASDHRFEIETMSGDAPGPAGAAHHGLRHSARRAAAFASEASLQDV